MSSDDYSNEIQIAHRGNIKKIYLDVNVEHHAKYKAGLVHSEFSILAFTVVLSSFAIAPALKQQQLLPPLF